MFLKRKKKKNMKIKLILEINIQNNIIPKEKRKIQKNPKCRI
jgi:hypothetical protein